MSKNRHAAATSRIANPIVVIADGAQFSQQVTRILFWTALLMVALVLAGLVFSDVWIAVAGATGVVLAVVALVAIAYAVPRWLGEVGVWAVRFSFAAFCVAAVLLFTDWAWAWPKPVGCAIYRDETCVTDVRTSAAFPGVTLDTLAQSLRDYLFPASRSGVADESNVSESDWKLVSRGKIGVTLNKLLYDPDLARDRNYLVDGMNGWPPPKQL